MKLRWANKKWHMYFANDPAGEYRRREYCISHESAKHVYLLAALINVPLIMSTHFRGMALLARQTLHTMCIYSPGGKLYFDCFAKLYSARSQPMSNSWRMPRQYNIIPRNAFAEIMKSAYQQQYPSMKYMKRSCGILSGEMLESWISRGKPLKAKISI